MTSTSPAKPPTTDGHDDEHPELSARNARAGLWLFAVYLIAYGIFMALAAFSPRTIGTSTAFGPNVAILYGIGLIFGAVGLALVYMLICKLNADRFSGGGEGK